MDESDLKHFGLTHIVYSPASVLGVPLALLSLSPIFLFVAYFALLVFGRRLSLLLLAAGSVLNEALSLMLKRAVREPRPFPHRAHVGDGFGWPSSHAQAGAFVFAWGIAYALSIEGRYPAERVGARTVLVRRVRYGIYVFGLAAWSSAVAYSRYALHYHSIPQVIAGFVVGLIAGAAWYLATEHIPFKAPRSLPGRVRAGIEHVWIGVGGIGGWQLGAVPGGWGEGWVFGVNPEVDGSKKVR